MTSHSERLAVAMAEHRRQVGLIRQAEIRRERIMASIVIVLALAASMAAGAAIYVLEMAIGGG